MALLHRNVADSELLQSYKASKKARIPCHSVPSLLRRIPSVGLQTSDL